MTSLQRSSSRQRESVAAGGSPASRDTLATARQRTPGIADIRKKEV